MEWRPGLFASSSLSQRQSPQRQRAETGTVSFRRSQEPQREPVTIFFRSCFLVPTLQGTLSLSPESPHICAQ